MNETTTRSTTLIAFALALLMAATRSHHFAAALHLPDASWAVFFLAGVYLRAIWVFPALLAGAAFLDFAAITWGGVSSFCISPAYGFLLPAYGALWLAGRWYARRQRFQLATLIPLVSSMLVGAAVCELFSSGGFYFLSGRFDPSLTEFGTRLARYLPPSLAAMAFYVALAAIAHAALGAVGERGASLSRPPAP
ncbi:MAG: hypothetical protein ACREYF_17525 [Gammaproteobacteria bacterium]